MRWLLLWLLVLLLLLLSSLQQRTGECQWLDLAVAARPIRFVRVCFEGGCAQRPVVGIAGRCAAASRARAAAVRRRGRRRVVLHCRKPRRNLGSNGSCNWR